MPLQIIIQLVPEAVVFLKPAQTKTCRLNWMHQSEYTFKLSGVAQVLKLNRYLYTVSSLDSVSDYNGLYLILMQHWRHHPGGMM